VQQATKSPTRRPVQHHTPSTSTRFDTVVGENVPPRKRKRNTQEDDNDKNNNNDNNKHRDKGRPHPARDCW
jgi:hypothetical protein